MTYFTIICPFDKQKIKVKESVLSDRLKNGNVFIKCKCGAILMEIDRHNNDVGGGQGKQYNPFEDILKGKN